MIGGPDDGVHLEAIGGMNSLLRCGHVIRWAWMPLTPVVCDVCCEFSSLDRWTHAAPTPLDLRIEL